MSIANEEEVLLLTVTDEREAEMILSLLEAHGITVLAKHRGSGDYLKIYMGMSSLGIDIFVRAEELARAKEIIEFDYEEEISDYTDLVEDNYNSPNSKLGLFIFITLVVLLIVAHIVNK